MTTFTIEPRGAFSLRESALFGFGGREGTWDGQMRMAFTTDDLEHQAGVVLTQDDAGVHVEVSGDADVEKVRAQVARVLSIDVDGTGFEEVAGRDSVIGALVRLRPGLRPPQFHSPYEAAVWSVLSARRPAAQMALVRRRLSEAHGATFALAGETWAAVPTPRQLLGVAEFPGIPQVKLERLHAVATAALDGRLDVARLAGMHPGEAMLDLQRLPGFGPFYSSLVVIRACGLTDVLPTEEPKSLELTRRLYDLEQTPTPAQLTAIAEPWRPWRTWAVVHIRAVGDDLLRARAVV